MVEAAQNGYYEGWDDDGRQMVEALDEEDDPFKEDQTDDDLVGPGGQNAESSSSPPSGVIKPAPVLTHDMIMTLHYNRPIPVRLPEKP